MRTQIIEINNSFRIFSFLLLLIAFILLAVNYLDFRHFNLVMAIILLPSALFGFSNFRFKSKGNLDIEENKIIINLFNDESRELDLTESIVIKLFLENIEKRLFSKTYFFKLFLNFNDNEEIITFKVEERYIERLKKIIEKWYLNKFNFKEYLNTGQRLFLLNPNLTYRNIQEIKEKYNISW